MRTLEPPVGAPVCDQQFVKLLGKADATLVWEMTSKGKVTRLNLAALGCVIMVENEGEGKFKQRYMLIHGKPLLGTQKVTLICDARIGAPILEIRTFLLPPQKPQIGFSEAFEMSSHVTKTF